MRSKTDISKANAELLILAALRSGAQHGYSLARAIEDKSSGTFTFNDGVLYPSLHRLEADGCVTSKWAEKGGRRRRVYSLTPAGRKRLVERKAEWEFFVHAVRGLLGAGHA